MGYRTQAGSGVDSVGSRTGAASNSSWMACGMEEATFLLLCFQERGSGMEPATSGVAATYLAASGGAAASSASTGGAAVSSSASGDTATISLAATGGAAAAPATASGGAAAGSFFLLLLWLQVIGGLGLPLTPGGKGGQSVDWDFRLG